MEPFTYQIEELWGLVEVNVNFYDFPRLHLPLTFFLIHFFLLGTWSPFILAFHAAHWFWSWSLPVLVLESCSEQHKACCVGTYVLFPLTAYCLSDWGCLCCCCYSEELRWRQALGFTVVFLLTLSLILLWESSTGETGTTLPANLIDRVIIHFTTS